MERPDQDQPTALEQQVAERTRELAVLNTIAAVVSQSLDVQQMLEAALDEVRGLLRMEYGCIYSSAEHSGLRMIAQRGLTAELIEEQQALPLQHTLSGTVAQTGQALAYENLEEHRELDARALSLGLRSYVGVPLRSMRQVIGVLVLLSTDRVPVDNRDLRLLEAIGDHIGVALANAQLFEAEQRRRRQAETLQEVATVVGSSLSLSEVLQRILEQLSRVVPYDSATVQLLREDMTEVIAARGFPDADNVVGTHFPLDEAHPYNVVVRRGQPLILDEAEEVDATSYRFLASQTRSWLGVPLTFQGRIIGMLTLNCYLPGGYQDEDAALAASFASQAALALERARLLEAERRRRKVAEALREGLVALTSTLNLSAVLDAIVSQACKLMGTDYCAIYELGADGFLRARAARGLPEDYVRSVQLPLGQPALGLAVEERRVVALPDAPAFAARLNPRFYDAQSLRQVREVSNWLRSLLAAPIVAGNEIYGGIVVYYEEEGEPTPEEEGILTIFASQAALAIKNARLLERERQQQAELQALNDRIAALNAIGRAAAASLNPEETLPGLSAAVQRLITHDRLVLALLDDREQQVTLLAHPPIHAHAVRGARYGKRALTVLPADSPIRRVLEDGQMIVVDRLGDRQDAQEALLRGLGSLIATPLVLHGRMLGVLCLASAVEHEYQAEQASIADEIAEEIAAAIVNALLYHRSRKLVLAEERNRLARELHDSVTQSLFSISLTAQTARMRLDTRPTELERVLTALSTIQELAQSALGEMRSLIYELRPATLEEEGLLAALKRHSVAFTNRAGIEITLALDESLAYDRLSPAAEEAIYRIAQEALNNVYKHAAAQHIRLSLLRLDTTLVLEVKDDGRGFDPSSAREGQHLGCSIMRERAEALGGTLSMVSAPGSGTLVRAQLPLERRSNLDSDAVETSD